MLRAMTVETLITDLQPYRLLCLALLCVPLLLTGMGALIKRKSHTGASRFLSLPVYMATMPGVCAAMMGAYMLFIARVNLIQHFDIVFGVAPIIFMVITLIAVSKVMPLDEVAGFGRISGLMMLCGCAFAITLVIVKTRIFIGFFASIWVLVGFFIILVLLMAGAWSKLKGK